MDTNRAEREAKRVLIMVSRRSPQWEKAWAFPEELIVIALRLAQESGLLPPCVQEDSSATRFLAKERWDGRVFIVFDVYHDTYDPDRAHMHGQDDLPVIEVYLSRKEVARMAGKPTANKVNGDVRALHNATGLGSRPPFSVDHSQGKVPFYNNPRSSESCGETSSSLG